MSKKMCPNKTTPRTPGYEPAFSAASGIDYAKGYTPPQLHETADSWYIEFYSYDPALGRMRRKRIKINRIKGTVAKRSYARQVIKRLSEQLAHGWNPWVAKDPSNLILFSDAVNRFSTHIEKMLASGYYRKETYDGYKSNLKIMGQFITSYRPLHYVYQFDRTFCVDFLDHIFIDRNNGAQTRNNYLNFLRVFSGFLVEKGYLKTKPTDGIAPISKRLYQKEREVIPLDEVRRLAGYGETHDPHFLLACYLLYYCFIRPVEMTRLTVANFNVKDCTITIPGSASKNKKTQTVTVPKKVIHYAASIGVLSAPAPFFIFSAGLRPGTSQIDPKIFRDHWDLARKALGFKKTWKFYSLKDTGITELLDGNMASIAVRDQARHSSLLVTDVYTNHKTSANKDIVSLDGAL